MSELSDLPVLILAYNRFDKFHKCFNTLKDQGIKKIFISIDGPSNNYDIISQKKILNYCKYNVDDLDIKIKHFAFNNGCRLGPIKGISWFFDLNKYGVILEDDVIISQNCIESFNFLLKNKINSKEYMSISSFNEFTNNKKESLYSLPVWRSWGWASWSDRWINHVAFLKEIKSFSLWQLYQLMPIEFRSIEIVKLVKYSQLNLLDAWDYEFNFSHIVNKKSSLTLGGINTYSYGFDNAATHTFDINSFGIDFDLFGEREINLAIVSNIKKSYCEGTLKKCGFQISVNNSFLKKFIIYSNLILYPLFLHMQKIKRIMFKRL